MLCNLSVRMLKFFIKRFKKKILPSKSLKKHPKNLHTYGSWEVFFSAALTAQNSPELHFRFINYFIQSSLLRSLIAGSRSTLGVGNLRSTGTLYYLYLATSRPKVTEDSQVATRLILESLYRMTKIGPFSLKIRIFL